MTSIISNSSAMAALHTLRSINSRLEGVQNQVSSGYRVEVAADNSAYWSIATTMRSDQLAMHAVQDAIGLGSAKVDIAYAAMDSTIEVLSEFHAKLIAAKEPGVDRAKIQTELEALKSQAVSIAKSASFNGVNWLNTSFADLYDVTQTTEKLLTSFVRSNDGSVSVKSADLNLSNISLFNSTGGGLLQSDDRSPGTVGGIRNTIYEFKSSGVGSGQNYIFDGPLTFIDSSTAVTFTLTLDADDPLTTTGAQSGVTQTYTIDRAAIDAVNSGWNGVVSTRDQWTQVLRSVSGGSFSASRQVSSTTIYGLFSSEVSARGSSYNLTGVSSTLSGGKTGGLQDSTAISYGSRAFTYGIWDGPFEMKPTVEAYIAITENDVEKTLTLTRDTVMAALGTTTGEVNSFSDFIQVLNYAFTNQGMGIKATNIGSGFIRYDLIETIHPQSGSKTSIGVTGMTDNIGNPPPFGLLDVDVTSNYSLDGYIDGVQTMLSRVIDGAAGLGAVKSRLEMQESYNQVVIDSVKKGIGRLVDADMNEAAMRLKALETQQQLSIQALNIANSSPGDILQLFR